MGRALKKDLSMQNGCIFQSQITYALQFWGYQREFTEQLFKKNLLN